MQPEQTMHPIPRGRRREQRRILTIHMGMPKTGTSALQQRLADSASILADQDIDYPALFRNEEGIAHHNLANGLVAGTERSGELTSSVSAYLNDSRFKCTLFSSEAFTNCLSQRVVFRLMRMLDELSEISQIKLVLSLRRVDSFLESM